MILFGNSVDGANEYAFKTTIPDHPSPIVIGLGVKEVQEEMHNVHTASKGF